MSEVRPGEVLTWQGVVAPADCDHLGHMNVQHYFAAAGDGMFAFGHEYGLSTGEVTRRRMCFVVVHSEADFRRELRGGRWVNCKMQSANCKLQGARDSSEVL